MKNIRQLRDDLKKAIQREADKLLCEAHPALCALRDVNYSRLERLVIAEVFSDKYIEPPSIQMALAALEMELDR